MVLLRENLVGFIHHSWGRFPTWHQTSFSLLHFSLIQIHFLFFAGPGFWNFVRNWKEAITREEKTRNTYLLIGFVFGYTGWIDFYSAFGFGIYPIGHFSILVFCCIIFYTIVRHQFLDIKILLKRVTLIFLIYAALLLAAIPSAIFVARRWLNEPLADPLKILIVIGLAMGLFLSTGPALYALFVRRSYWLRGHSTTGLTHELKSPLNVIESAVDVALDDLKAPTIDKAHLTLYLEMIQNNTTRLQTFVKDLLTVAKTSDDEIPMEKQRVDLRQLAQSVLEVQTPAADQKKLKLKLEPGGDCLAEVDASKIRQVLSNLVSNAIKFSDTGTITLSLEKQKGNVLFTVRDEGVGISPKHLHKIFERFYQARPGHKGTGIGLTIAKAWVEAHGGKIWAESEGEGKGTTMRFTVPGAWS